MCDCDFDYPKLQSLAFRTARKPHKCDECGRQIEPGEKYRIDKVLTDSWYSSKTCEDCQTLHWWACRQLQEFCAPLGDLHSCLEDADIATWDEDLETWIECPPGISFTDGSFVPDRALSIAREIYEERQITNRRDLASLRPWVSRQIDSLTVLNA